MAWLRLNGYKIQVADESTVVEDDTPQDQWRSVNAVAQSQYTGSKRMWSFETTAATTIEEAIALEHLLRPQDNGHVWDAKGLYSSKLMKVVDTPGLNQPQNPWDDPHAKSFRIPAGLLPRFVVAALPAKYTLMAWCLHDTTWRHLAVRSDGAGWVNGVRGDGSELLTAISTTNPIGYFSIERKGADVAKTTDLVIYPFEVPDLWPEQYDRSRPHSPLPRLRASGDFWPEPVEAEVSGKVSVKQIHTIDGVRGIVSFQLREV